ncbi:cytochrome bd biosynthesis protein [Photobacterium aquae]|uniref:Cytochrome bd biosynthesis protein n=1 Tax=Photobacterium aquae TaxID=1195763 RepID=A0A0J1HBW9_9GAMM|nr:cyd operon protein YbgE [Photobacterium aquae]KLV09106.1 cytochrome bd biosynthesis protein [Photobacterium aquae]
MSNINHWVKRIHQWLDFGLLRVLGLVMSLVTACLVVWEPTLFAQSIGGFGPIISPAMIWATCAAMVFGVGFIPHRWYWQLFFTPYLSLPILAYILMLRLL